MPELKEAIARLRESIAHPLKGNAFGQDQWTKGYCAGVLAALTAFDDHKQPLLNAAEEVEQLSAASAEFLDAWERYWRLGGMGLTYGMSDGLRRSLQTHGRVPESTPEAKQEVSPARKEKAE